MTRKTIENAMTGVLVVCAVIVTGLVVRREVLTAAARKPRLVANWRQLAAEGSLMGRADAPVQMVEFSDFQCPYCAQLHPTLKALRDRYPDEVAVVYRHLPSRAIHPFAVDAALAAECAGAQGRFAQYHDQLFEHQDEIGHTPWTAFARAAGVPDAREFERCVRERRFAKRVDQDVELARRIGVTQTPTTIVNGRVLIGALAAAELERSVKEARRSN